MLASSDAPLFNLAAMDADLALANAQQPQQRHSNSANNNSTRSRPRAAPYLRRASDLTSTTSSSVDKRPSVSSVLLSQLASSLDPELQDPDDAFDVPNVGSLGGTSPSGISGTKSSTTSATLSAAGGGRRSRARAGVCILSPPQSSKMGSSGLPGPLRKEAYRRARSCPLEPHAELPHRNTMFDANHDSLRCLQVPPSDDLFHDGHNGSQKYFETMAGKRTFGQATDQQENIGTPLASQIAASIHLTDAELSERTAALNFILTNPAHFRQLQSDLRSSSVITTHCSSVVLDQLLSERVARMRQVREEALQKMREERDREREYARQMGLLAFDDHGEEDGTHNSGMGKNAKGKVAGWDHLLAGLTSVANLGAGLLNKQSSTLSDEQHPRHPRQQHNYNHHHQVHDDGMDWNIDQPGMAAAPPTRPSSIVALQDMQTSQQQQQVEQGKKTSLSTVAETMSRSSSGDFSLGEEQMQQTQEVAAVRKASLDSSAAASLRASYSFSSKSSTSSSLIGEGKPSAPPTAAGPTTAKASASAATTRRGGRRRSLVARGA